MKSYQFSNWRYCKICGHTNKEFKVFPYTNGNVWLSKICKECYLEYRRKTDKKIRKTEHYKAYQKKYQAEYGTKNIEAMREKNRRYRERLKYKKKLRRLQLLQSFKTMK